MSITSSDVGHRHRVLGRLVGRGRPPQRPRMVSQSLIHSFARESLRAILVGLVRMEPMAGACLAEAEAHSAAAGAANYRG